MDWDREILSANKLYLYGAGIIAYGIREALRVLYAKEIEAHIVTEKNPVQQFYAGKIVVSVQELPADMPESIILIATPPEYHSEIQRTLREHGIHRFIALDDFCQYRLMSRYFQTVYGFRLLADLTRKEHNSTACAFEILMAKSTMDKPLKEAYALPQHVIPVQAGASIDGRIENAGMHYDDEGDNISARNREYSELTVTYWAWKHSSADYVGICHYRRILELSEVDYHAVETSDVDAVLPLPYLCEGDASFQYSRYVSDEEMGVLFSVLSEAEKKALSDALRLPYLYNHNLVIARRAVFEDYCHYLFAILQRVDKAMKPFGWRTARRMGYLGEILTSVYFTTHADRLRIVHAPNRWMV